MASSTLTIALPEPFKSYVEAHVADGSYASPADYVEHLILTHQRTSQSILEARLASDSDDDAITIPHDVLERGKLVEYLEAHAQALP